MDQLGNRLEGVVWEGGGGGGLKNVTPPLPHPFLQQLLDFSNNLWGLGTE
jgi:hypothetical protein